MCLFRKDKKMGGRHRKPERVKVLLKDEVSSKEKKRREKARKEFLRRLDKSISAEDVRRLERAFLRRWK